MMTSNIINVLCALFLSTSLTQAQLSPECSNKDQNYAWNAIEELVTLGIDYGIIVKDTHDKWHCLAEIDPFDMLPSLAEPSHFCHKVLAAVKEQSVFKKERVRIMLPFNRTLYYATDNGVQNPLQLPNTIPFLNPKYAMLDIGDWVKNTIGWHQVEAIALVSNTKSTPRYPSAILVLQDPALNRVFKYIYTNPTNRMDTTSYFVGHFPKPVNAVYLRKQSYHPTVQMIIFFENFYAKTKLQIDKEQPDKQISAFPILPIQGIFGCPIHICWWPVMDDLLYYNSAYYLFQGRWMFHIKEGETNSLGLYSENVYDLTKFNIAFTVQAAYYDFSLSRVIFIRKLSRHKFQLVPIIIQKADNHKVLLIVNKDIDVQLADIGDSKMLSATHLNSTKNTKLWIVYRRLFRESLQIIGYELLYDSSGKPTNYVQNVKITSVQHTLITSVFYHYPSQHLYLVSGFFMYIYKEADIERMKQSLCSVTTVSHFFNCSDSYYNMDRMKATSPIKLFLSKKSYFDQARERHEGEFLPGQCNFLPEMPLDRIPFKEKEHSATTTTGTWFKTIYAWMLFALVSGIIVTFVGFYGVSALGNVFPGGRTKRSAGRRSGESKLRAFLKSNYFQNSDSSAQISSDPISSSQTNDSSKRSPMAKRPTVSKQRQVSFVKSCRSTNEITSVQNRINAKSPAKRGKLASRRRNDSPN